MTEVRIDTELTELWAEMGLADLDMVSLQNAQRPLPVVDMIELAIAAGIQMFWDSPSQSVKLIHSFR